MYGSNEPGGDEASTPPNCPACQGKTYYVDPEQTVITCYDCGRYFRRKKPGAEEPGTIPAVPAPPAAPVPEPPAAPAPEVPSPPPPPEPLAAPAPEPPPESPSAPEPPEYVPPPPPPTVPEPHVPEPVEEGDFDLVMEEGAGGTEPAGGQASPGGEVACSVCGFPMDSAWKVCPNCVSRYEIDCDGCGRQLQAWWLICPWCETPKHPDHIHVHK